MITVRFPTGFSVQYNDLNWAKLRDDGSILLYLKEGSSGWSAVAPAGSLVEVTRPCRTYFATDDAEVRNLEKEIRSLNRKLAKALKERNG